MRVFNLNFGSPETPEEKALYSQELYPQMAQLHESLLRQYDGQLPGTEEPEEDAPASRPSGAFEGFDPNDLGLTPEEQTRESNRSEPGSTLDPSS